MLKNGIKPIKSNFIISSLVNIFLLIKMFFGCYQLCEGSGADYQESKGTNNGEGAHTVKEKVNWIQVAQYLWGSFNWEQIHKSNDSCCSWKSWCYFIPRHQNVTKAGWSCIIAPGVGDTLLWIPLSRYSTVLSTSGIARTSCSWGLIDFVC